LIPYLDYVPPVPQSLEFDYYQATYGATSVHPDWWSFNPWSGWSEEELNQFILKRGLVELEHVDFFSKKYRLKDYVALANSGSVSLRDWLGLGEDHWVEWYGYPTIIMDALLKENNERIEAINRQQKEKENQFKLESMNIGSTLNFGKANESMYRAFS